MYIIYTLHIYIYIYTHIHTYICRIEGFRFRRIPDLQRCISTAFRQPLLLKIHRRGVQWKQGVVIYMMLYTSLSYNTTPIHCTPLPLHPPSSEYPPASWCAISPRIYIYIYIYFYTHTHISVSYVYIYIYICIAQTGFGVNLPFAQSKINLKQKLSLKMDVVSWLLSRDSFLTVVTLVP